MSAPLLSGLLPVAAAGTALTLGIHASLCAHAPSLRRLHDRACATALLTLAAPIALVRALSVAHAIGAVGVFVGMFGVGVLGLALAGTDARARTRSDVWTAGRVLRDAFFGGAWGVGAGVGAAALAISLLAAYLLPVFAWDALGYHLPLVHDALQTGTMRTVPTGVEFINAYPRAVETYFIAWRALLPDDTLVDAAQAPFGLAAVIAAAAFATRDGVRPGRAVAWALCLLAVPAVALQIACNYVDVAVAAWVLLAAWFLTGELDRARISLAAVAIAMFLASKPSSPPGVLALGIVLLFRARHACYGRWALLALASAFVLGGERYLLNLAEHGNPVWPVVVPIGPWRLPGFVEARELLNGGVPEPYLHYGWLRRLATSWTALPHAYCFDMRIGGFGPLVAYGLLPGAMVAALLRRSRRAWTWVAVVAAATLSTPGAFWVRYVLAIPAVLLALVAVVTESAPARLRLAADGALAVLAAWGLALALPGYTDQGPSLRAVLASPPAGREVAASVDGAEGAWRDARSLVGAGEAFGYDATFWLPGLLWRPDGRGRVAYLPGDLSAPADTLRWIDRERVRVIVLGAPEDGNSPVVRAYPARFQRRFRCPVGACTVYAVRTSGSLPR